MPTDSVGGEAKNGWAIVIIDQLVIQSQTVAQTGIGIGSALAIVCSWQRKRSIRWAVLAGLLSWLYVFYFAATRIPEERK